MRQFEYLQVVGPSIVRLNELGAEGWEVVYVFEPPADEKHLDYTVLMKREISGWIEGSPIPFPELQKTIEAGRSKAK